MLSVNFKNRDNHLRQPQETPLRRYFTKSLILQGFQAAKNGVFSTFLSYYSPYFEATVNILYNKKTQKSLCLLRFRALLFFPLKTNNPLILYILIYFIWLKN